MADSFKTRTMKRKNVKGLALNAAPAPKAPAPSAGDAQIPGAIGNDGRGDTLEIGVEFRLDLRSEDLIVLKELGAGNGGTVSKVQHAATKVVMARKVRHRVCMISDSTVTNPVSIRLSMSRQRERCASASCGSCRSCTNATHHTLSPSMVPL